MMASPFSTTLVETGLEDGLAGGERLDETKTFGAIASSC